MTLLLEEETEVNFDFDYKQVANDVIYTALDQLQFPYDVEISLTITDSEGIHAINKEFRQIDAPTDVLSFPMLDYDTPGEFDFLDDNDDAFNPESGECILGDIVLNTERIISQAADFGHSVKREYAFLIAHSMMHLFGFDHMSEAEAADMEARQEHVLAELGITRE